MLDVFAVGRPSRFFGTAPGFGEQFKVRVTSGVTQESSDLRHGIAMNEVPSARRQGKHHAAIGAPHFVREGTIG